MVSLRDGTGIACPARPNSISYESQAECSAVVPTSSVSFPNAESGSVARAACGNRQPFQFPEME